jgi:DNA-binding LacI/PurR family transcriptional regulator
MKFFEYNGQSLTLCINESSSESIYIQLSNHLRAYIIEQDIQPGTMLPSMKNIADSAGVGLKTAERTLGKLIKDGICIRRPKKGTFVANWASTKISGSVSSAIPCIAFLLLGADFSHPYHMQILSGAEEEVSAQGFNLLYYSVSENDNNALVKRLKSLACQKNLHSILLDGKYDHKTIRLIKSALPNINPIIIGASAEGFYEGLTHIIHSNALAIRTALKALQDNGHERIAFLNKPLTWLWNREIRDEFFKFMKSNNLPLIREVILDDLSGNSPDIGYEAIEKILPELRKQSITAILCGSDNLASGAMKRLKEDGLKIPDDISIIGRGNLVFCEYLDPPLTTIDLYEEEKGCEGIRAALGNYPHGSIIRLPIKMIERQTVKNLKLSNLI